MIKFILISSLIILLSLPSSAQLSSAAYPFTGDARLTKTVTSDLRDGMLIDLMANMEQASQVKLYPDPDIINEKITVICHDKPLGSILRGVADVLHLEWKKEQKNGVIGYTLFRSKEETKREEDEAITTVNSRIRHLAEAIASEAALAGTFEQLKSEEIQSKYQEIKTKLTQEQDNNKKGSLTITKAVLGHLLDRSEGWRMLYRLLRMMPMDTLISIIPASVTEYTHPIDENFSENDGVPFPDPLKEVIARDMSSVDYDLHPNNSVLTNALLQFNGKGGKKPSLFVKAYFARLTANGQTTDVISGSLPSIAIDFNGSDSIPIQPSGWQNDTLLSANADLDSVTADGAVSKSPNPIGEDIASKISLITPTPNVIADSLWTTRITSYKPLKKAPIGEILTYLARQTNHYWRIQDGIIRIQSRTFSADRAAEPPSTLISDLMKHTADGTVSLEDAGAICALPDEQYRTALEMRDANLFHMPFADNYRMVDIQHVGNYSISKSLDQLEQLRYFLALYKSLNKEQKTKIKSSGLIGGDLDNAQKEVVKKLINQSGQENYGRISHKEIVKDFPDNASIVLSRKNSNTVWAIRSSGPGNGYNPPGTMTKDDAWQKLKDMYKTKEAKKDDLVLFETHVNYLEIIIQGQETLCFIKFTYYSIKGEK